MLGYNKVHQLGDRHIAPLLNGEINIEEKVDGSQFRIMLEHGGKISCGSKNVEFNERGLDNMFKKGVELAEANLKPLTMTILQGQKWHIFAEYLESPKHNTLVYERVPNNHIMVFDICIQQPDGQLQWVSYNTKKLFAETYGFEVIPLIWSGNGAELTNDKIMEMIKQTSVLGKATVEGIVIKNYSQYFDPVKFPYLAGMFMVGKFVRSEFKEANRDEWKLKKNSIEGLAESLRTEARWRKAIQHLRDQGQLQYNMTDMKNLIPELNKDIIEEEKESIMEALWDMHKKKLLGTAQQGLAEFYKEWLLEAQMNKDEKRLEEFNQTPT